MGRKRGVRERERGGGEEELTPFKVKEKML
jgi:hypothetical protein